AQQGARATRQDGDLGYFGVGDQALFVFVPDRVRVVDRNPGRLLDTRDRFNDSCRATLWMTTWTPKGVTVGDDGREPGPTTAGRGDHIVPVVRGVGADGDQPGPTTGPGGDQGVGDDPGRTPGGVGGSPTQPGRDH